MRNLKKFLALVLAMMMALSLMVTANATSTGTQYGDNASVTPAFEEAVDVLTGMGVFSGDNGDFRPASNVTRAEVAALIYRLATGDVTDAQAGLYAEYGNFSDVRPDAWYAGYVGYCANAGYIKGRPGNVYDPTGNVTGYEALAMILRVIGYDKNGEFTGATWQTEVSAMSQRLGILTNIKTTSYGNTLHLASRRDVVAELLFQADSKVNMVNYTPAFGYQPFGDVNNNWGNLTGGAANNTLGWKIFGLTSRDGGVVIGNEETGESTTVLGYASNNSNITVTTAVDQTGGAVTELLSSPSWSAFTYAGTYHFDAASRVLLKKSDGTAFEGNVSLGDNTRYDFNVGVDKVAHEMKVWFDGRNENYSNRNGYHTYAYFDNSTLAKVVKVSASTGGAETEVNRTSMGASGANDVVANRYTSLFDAMKAAGFSVSAGTSAYISNSFSRFSLNTHASFNSANVLYTMGGANGAAAVRANNGYADDTIPNVEESPERLYMVVSNNASKAPDAVISLNLQASQVSGVDNVNTIKTVTVPFVDGAFDTDGDGITTDEINAGNNDWAYIRADNVLTNAAVLKGAVPNGILGGTLEQKQLVGDSAKTRDQKEVGLHITGTRPYTPERTAAGSRGGAGTAFDRDWFKLDPVTEVKDGVVAAYNDTTVTLSDGTVLEKSIVYDAVVPGTIPQVANDRYEFTGYRFYITEGNKFVGAERQFGTTFIYGTYMDYDTKTSSSTFNYYLTGVTLDGETTTVPVKTLATSNIAAGTPINSTNALGVPFRDTANQIGGTYFINGLGVGVYRGFTYGNDSVNWSFEALDDIKVVSGQNVNPFTNTNTGPVAPIAAGPATENTNEPTVSFDGDATLGTPVHDVITINATRVNLGAAYAGSIDMDGTAGTTPSDELYFTANTKFILVSGFGEDSLKPVVYDGIEALLGDSTTVTIDLDQVVDNTTADALLAANAVRLPGISDGVKLSDMTYLTQSPFLYAQNQVLSRQADVIILPAVAVTRTGTASLRYVGNATPTNVNSNPVIGSNATQFTMYNNGVAESIWVEGLVDTTQAANVPGVAATRNSATLVAYGNVQNNTHRYHDHFWNLTDTGRKANDGQPIYSVAEANLLWTQNAYVASTYSAQTGSFTTMFAVTDSNGTVTAANTTRMRNVASATITNLNKDNAVSTDIVWPGIENLQTLNEAGSMGIYTGVNNQYGGTQRLYVSAITGGNQTVTQIYVCYDQTTPTHADVNLGK